MEIWAYQPKMMMGMGRFNQAVRKGHSVDQRLKNLMSAATLDGHEDDMIHGHRLVDMVSPPCPSAVA
jgi:hypothetical protein